MQRQPFSMERQPGAEQRQILSYKIHEYEAVWHTGTGQKCVSVFRETD